MLVVGQLFDGNVAPVPVDRTPERAPPAVVKNPDLTLPGLREAQKRIPWPLLHPTVVERSSQLSTSSGTRVYSVAGHKTVRLTFSQAIGEYWGIQMMKWREAPALQAPTRKLYVKGRRYDLHYVGPKLHMVVLRRERRDLLGREHDPRLALERDDAGDREGVETAPEGDLVALSH